MCKVEVIDGGIFFDLCNVFMWTQRKNLNMNDEELAHLNRSDDIP